MKLKHSIAIFTFLAAFGLSVFFARLFLTEPACDLTVRAPQKPPVAVRPANHLTARMRDFLEADRKTGYELSKDLMELRRTTDEVSAEARATAVLVLKMEKADCVGLPNDFCAAWQAHFNAWSEKGRFFEEAAKFNIKTIQGDRAEREAHLSREISRTYNEMLAVARRYGVDFRN